MSYAVKSQRPLTVATLLSLLCFLLIGGQVAYAQNGSTQDDSELFVVDSFVEELPPPETPEGVAVEMTSPEPVRVLENKTFNDSKEIRQKILAAYEGLTVADVTDALDLIGLQDVTLLDRSIRPLGRDLEDFSHRFVGFALTMRYLPTNVRVGVGSFDSLEEAKEWKAKQYARAGEPWTDLIKPGSVVVVDQTGAPEAGHIGSNNFLGWAEAGAVGVVTDGGTRDTDEVLKLLNEAIPVYTKYVARGVRPGRSVLDAYQVPVAVGGVLIWPGDVIVADGDGVVKVPRQYALEVARLAREIMEGRMSGRLGEELQNSGN